MFVSLQRDFRETDFSDDLAAFLPAAEGIGRLLPSPRVVGLQITAQPLAELLPDPFRQEHRKALPDQLVGMVSKNLLDGRIGELDDARGIHENDRVRRIFPKQTVTLLALAQSLFGPATGGAHFSFAQLAFHRRSQARQVALHQIIIGAGLHRGPRHVLANAARDDEERQIQPALLDDLERLRRAEGRHVVIGENDVPPFLAQRRAQGLRGIDALEGRLITALTQRIDEDARVKLRVLDDQHPERRFLLSGAHKRQVTVTLDASAWPAILPISIASAPLPCFAECARLATNPNSLDRFGIREMKTGRPSNAATRP